MTRSRASFVALLLPLVGMSARAPEAYGSAIAITEMSARGLGTAFAAGGSAAQDAGAQWFNPAAMVVMDHELAATASLVAPEFEFEDGGSVQMVPGGMVPGGTLPLLPGTPSTGQGGASRVVPALFYQRAVGEDFRVGVGLNSPFGLATEYDEDWRGRYQAVDSEIVDINLNGNVAYALDDRWSVGAGLSVNYLDAELSNAIDFAAVCAAAAGGACPNGAVPGQGQFDGFLQNEGDDVSFGFNAGVMWRTASTRVGLAYRSEIEHDVEGTADFRLPGALGGVDALPPPLAGALQARFQDTDLRAPLTLPDSVTLSGWHDFGRVQAVASVAWFDWSDITEVRILLDNPAAEPLVEPLGWDSTVRAAAGLIFDATPKWTLRTGVAYDESPTPGASLRSPRVPDNDRTWLAVGASYHVSERWSVDFGYARLLVDDTRISRAGATGGLLVGEYDSSADLLSLEVSVRL